MRLHSMCKRSDISTRLLFLVLPLPNCDGFTNVGDGLCVGPTWDGGWEAAQATQSLYGDQSDGNDFAPGASCADRCTGLMHCVGYAWDGTNLHCWLYGGALLLSSTSTWVSGWEALPNNDATIVGASGSPESASCWAKDPFWAHALVGQGHCIGPGGEVLVSRSTGTIASRGVCENACLNQEGLCDGYAFGETLAVENYCTLYGESMGTELESGWYANDASENILAGSDDIVGLSCFAAFTFVGIGGCSSSASVQLNSLVNARYSYGYTRTMCAELCIHASLLEGSPVCEGYSYKASNAACELYGVGMHDNLPTGWSTPGQRDATKIRGTITGQPAYLCFARNPWDEAPDQDCFGFWSDCSAACEGASARSWTQTVAQSGSGAACPPPSDCTSGDGECVTFTYIGRGLCYGANGAQPRHAWTHSAIQSQSSCRSYCEALGSLCVGYNWRLSDGTFCALYGPHNFVGAANWTMVDVQETSIVSVSSGHYNDACYVKDVWSEQPTDFEAPGDCAGSLSPCSAACELAATRTWTETTAQAGWGLPCPPAEDCATGEDDCVCNTFASHPTVQAGSCTECTGGATSQCLQASCINGFSSYANGTCCHTESEFRSASGCVCFAGLTPVSTVGCGPAFSCAAGYECTSIVECNTAIDCRQCGVGNWSAAGAQCESCPVGKVPNAVQSACEQCEHGKQVSAYDLGQCVCEEGSYSYAALPPIQCFDMNFVETSLHKTLDTSNVTAGGCHRCDAQQQNCLDCSGEVVLLLPGYQFLTVDASISEPRYTFKCKSAAACPQQFLQTQSDNVSTRLIAAACGNGTAGLLCDSCMVGWRKSPGGICRPCKSTNGGFLSAFLLIPSLACIAYVAFRKFLSYNRYRRNGSRESASRLFRSMDVNGDGTLTRDELRQGLSRVNGLQTNDMTLYNIINAVDLDHNGKIDEHEFVCWIEHSQSQAQRTVAVLKIVFGLFQVMTKQPTVLKSKQLLITFEELSWLNIFAFNFAWVMPVCTVDYHQSYFLNTVALPGCLLALVKATWTFSPTVAEHEDAEGFDQTKKERRSDYYIAFFLSYPTMTSTCFDHLRCRKLSTTYSVLESDHSVECYTSGWWSLAVISGLGILSISVGAPVGMWLWMRQKMNKEMHQVRSCQKGRIAVSLHLLYICQRCQLSTYSKCPLNIPQAYQNFSRKFDFMARDFRPECYYAECVDLLRKLTMSGILSLITPGSVMQGFCAVLFSVMFAAVHIKIWPYPSTITNCLKLFTDSQICFVTLIGLCMRIESDGSFNGQQLLVGLIVFTVVPVTAALFYKTTAENAQGRLRHLAKMDLLSEPSDHPSTVKTRNPTSRWSSEQLQAQERGLRSSLTHDKQMVYIERVRSCMMEYFRDSLAKKRITADEFEDYTSFIQEETSIDALVEICVHYDISFPRPRVGTRRSSMHRVHGPPASNAGSNTTNVGTGRANMATSTACSEPSKALWRLATHQESGRNYYINNETGASQWELPSDFDSGADQPL